MKTLQFIADCPKHEVIIIQQMNAISRKNMLQRYSINNYNIILCEISANS